MSKTIKSAGIILVCYLVLATTVTRGKWIAQVGIIWV